VSFDRNLLDIICCPVTRSPLELMPADLLARINALIVAGELKRVNDELVEQNLEAGLMTRDGRIAYPIRDGIPVLLEEHGILLGQLEKARVALD
jgi:uncharacterized protein YbaR (Trm112 family)